LWSKKNWDTERQNLRSHLGLDLFTIQRQSITERIGAKSVPEGERRGGESPEPVGPGFESSNVEFTCFLFPSECPGFAGMVFFLVAFDQSQMSEQKGFHFRVKVTAKSSEN
jgi:hypothetical protein